MKFTKLIASLAAITTIVSVMSPAVINSVAHADAEMDEAILRAMDTGFTSKNSLAEYNPSGLAQRQHVAHFFNVLSDELGLDLTSDNECDSYSDIATADPTLEQDIMDTCAKGLFKGGHIAFNPAVATTRGQILIITARMLHGQDYIDQYMSDNDMSEVEAAEDILMMDDVITMHLPYEGLTNRGQILLISYRISQMDMSEPCTEGVDCPVDFTGTTTTGEVVVPHAGTIDVSLASSTPSAAEVPASSSGLPVAKFDFTAGSSDVTISSVKLMRKGFSDEETLDGVALVGPMGRLTSARDENSTDNTVELSINNGGYVLKAGSTVTFTVVATVGSASAAANDTFGFQVVSVTSTALTSNVSSVVSPMMRVSSQDAPVVDFASNGSSSNVKIGQTAAEVGKFKITNNNSNQTVNVKSITFKEIGTVDENSELKNFALYIDNVQFGSTVPSIAGKYVTFTSTAGKVIATNNNVKLVLKAEIAGGAGKTVQFQLNNALDFIADGSSFGAGVGVSTAPVSSANAIDIEAGEITLEDIDAVSDKMREDKDDVVLGKIKISNVAGKSLEMQQFGVKVLLTAGSATVNSSALTLATLFENFELYNESNGATYSLDRNGSVYADEDLNIALAQGTTTFVIRADTKADIDNFDTASVDLSLKAGDVSSNAGLGGLYIVETDDDTEVTDVSPSSLSWKKVKGTESAATVSLANLSSVSKVRGAKDVVALQFNVEADESSALTMDEVQVNVKDDGGSSNATNLEVSEVALYKGTVAPTNLLKRVSGSNIAAGVATFDSFMTSIAANTTQTYVVTINFVDGTDAVNGSDYKVSLVNGGLSIDDDGNDPVTAVYPAVLGNRFITVTNAGVLTATADANNVDNKDTKTILGGTSANVYSIDVQATNENVDVETVTFTVDTDLTQAVDTASLYLRNPNDNSMTLIKTNANADITSSTITFRDLNNLIVPQETRELVLKLNTATIGFEKVGETTLAANVTDVDFEDMVGADSGKDVTDVSVSDTSKNFDIVPVKVTASLTTPLNANNAQARITLTIDKGANTVDASNAAPQATVTDLFFSELGNNTGGYKIYKEGNAALYGTVSALGVFTQGSMPNNDLVISSSATYVIVPLGAVDSTYSPVLLKNGVEYDVSGISGATGLTSNATDDLEIGSRTY